MSCFPDEGQFVPVYSLLHEGPDRGSWSSYPCVHLLDSAMSSVCLQNRHSEGHCQMLFTGRICLCFQKIEDYFPKHLQNFILPSATMHAM